MSDPTTTTAPGGATAGVDELPRDGKVILDWTPQPSDRVTEYDDIAKRYVVRGGAGGGRGGGDGLDGRCGVTVEEIQRLSSREFAIRMMTVVFGVRPKDLRTSSGKPLGPDDWPCYIRTRKPWRTHMCDMDYVPDFRDRMCAMQDADILGHVEQEWDDARKERFDWFLTTILGERCGGNHVNWDRAGIGLIRYYRPGDYATAALAVAMEDPDQSDPVTRAGGGAGGKAEEVA